MPDIIASIYICSPQLSLATLSDITGIGPSSDSHDKGTKRGGHGIWTDSVLRINSELPKNHPLEEHIESLLVRCRQTGAIDRLRGSDAKVHLDIAVMFSTANVTLELDPSHAQQIAEFGMGVVISAYPCND